MLVDVVGDKPVPEAEAVTEVDSHLAFTASGVLAWEHGDIYVAGTTNTMGREMAVAWLSGNKERREQKEQSKENSVDRHSRLMIENVSCSYERQ